jgi:GNAT superfamily N-acetyltransferase
MTTMNGILVREATGSDLPVIGKLLEDLTDAMDNTEGIDIGIALKNCKSLVNDAGSHFLVAAIEGTPVGFINFTIRRTILHRSPSALIDELVVSEEYQGRGVGKQLLLAAIEKCRQLGWCFSKWTCSRFSIVKERIPSRPDIESQKSKIKNQNDNSKCKNFENFLPVIARHDSAEAILG